MSAPHDPDSSSTLPPTSTSIESITPSLNDEQQPAADSERKHFSIERSLELERQLELEGDLCSSPPATPSVSASSILHLSQHAYQQSQGNDPLDPQILVHIITGLRKTVEDMTQERDDLLKLLERATTKEASLQDTLALMTEKATDYEEELSTAKKKMKDDEEAISLLRNKVEESRRGLMRLQAESRRQSVQITQAPGPIDLSRAGISGLGLISPLPSASSKRASFTPLTGRSSTIGGGHGHRRVSSIAGDGNGLSGHQLPMDMNNPSSSNSQLTFNNHDGPPQSSALRSLFRTSPNAEPIPLPPTTTSTPSPEVEALKKEIESLKKELAHTRVESAEAHEAKEASDMCIKVLREFIAENQVGVGAASGDLSASLKLPPPPRSVDFSDKKAATAALSSGWGFKLWKADNTMKAPISTTIPSPTNSASSSIQTPTAATVSAPFSRLGGFFSSRASVSSTTSSSLQTNAALPLTRESGTSYRDSISGHSISVTSDGSSVVEPASPENEFSTPQGNVKVVVHDVSENGGESIEVSGMIREIPAVEKDSVQVQQSAAVLG